MVDVEAGLVAILKKTCKKRGFRDKRIGMIESLVNDCHHATENSLIDPLMTSYDAQERGLVLLRLFSFETSA